MYNMLYNDVNKLYPALRDLVEGAHLTATRNGDTYRHPTPITWGLSDPMKRVLYSRPKANPFFHLFEAMWMLAGSADVASLEFFVPRMKSFTDDGITVPGAYGKRWHKDYQLAGLIYQLQEDPMTRRAVLQHWDASVDQERALAGGKDVPCNTHIYFSRVSGRLTMTVCNRSNDLLWGAMGTNVVHFAFLQEYVAEQLGCGLGAFWTMSNDLHMYVKEAERNPRDKVLESMPPIPEKPCSILHHRLGSTDPGWQEDLTALVLWARAGFPTLGEFVPEFKNSWFLNVVKPMMTSFSLFKTQTMRPEDIAQMIELNVLAEDWARAGSMWMRNQK